MVRQAHHERYQQLAVRPELVEGLVQRFLGHRVIDSDCWFLSRVTAWLAAFVGHWHTPDQ
jgi:hypothetical protein